MQAPPRPRSQARIRRTRSPRSLAAGQLLILGVVAYAGAALLNSITLVRMAERQRLGSWERSLYLSLTRPVHSLSQALLIDRPHHAIDDLRGKIAPAPTTTTTPTATPTTTPVVPNDTTVTETPTTPTTAAPVETTVAAPRVPTTDDPLRLWIGGDSEAQALGTALEAITSQKGVIKATLEYKVSSGLSRPDYFDWPAELANVVAAANGPEVMVVIFGGNDAQPLQLADGKVYDVTDQPWQDEYRRRVGATMDLLGAAGRKVIWVGPPNAKSATFTTRLAVLSQIYSEEAAKRPDTIAFLDSRILFSDAKGGYTAYLPDASGKQVLMRTQDGFHLSIAGANRLGRAVYTQLQALVPALNS
jgi:uncharacterized protein